MGFPCGSADKESAYNADTWVWSLGWEDPREGKGYPLQYSSLGNSMVCIVCGVAKSWAQLSDSHFHFPLLILVQIKPRDVLFIRMGPFDMVLYKRNESKLLESFNIQEKESKKYLKNQQIWNASENSNTAFSIIDKSSRLQKISKPLNYLNSIVKLWSQIYICKTLLPKMEYTSLSST